MFEITKKERCPRQGKPSTGFEISQNTCSKSKRTKIIAKEEKSSELSFNISLYDNIPKQKLTRQQRMEIQKEKNRLAAQISRDRQKKYLQQLQIKIQELQTALSHQLCRVCKNSLIFQEDKPNDFFLESSKDEVVLPLPPIEDQSSLQHSNFYRDQSSISVKSVSQFLLIFTVLLSISAFGASIETQVSTNNFSGRLMQEINKQNEISNQQSTGIEQDDYNYFQKFVGEQCEIVPSQNLENSRKQFISQIGQKINFQKHDQWSFTTQSIVCSKTDSFEYLKTHNSNKDKKFSESLIKTILDSPDLLQSLHFKSLIKQFQHQIWISTYSVIKLFLWDLLDI